MSWRLPGGFPSTGSSWRLGSTPSSISSQASSASHIVGWGGWREVERGELVDLVLVVGLLDLEAVVLEPAPDEGKRGDLEGRGRKSSFAMQAEVIWRLEEFDEQLEEEEKNG